MAGDLLQIPALRERTTVNEHGSFLFLPLFQGV